jgi:hypothetical protein
LKEYYEGKCGIKQEREGRSRGTMFVKRGGIEKKGRKVEKAVDMGGRGVVLYSSARETGPEREPERARES